MADPNDYYRSGPIPGPDTSLVVIVAKRDYDIGLWSEQRDGVFMRVFELVPELVEQIGSVFSPRTDMNPSQLEGYLAASKIPYSPQLDMEARSQLCAQSRQEDRELW